MAGLSKEEYLKRYMSTSNDEQKIKKKRKKKSSLKPMRKECGMKIVDDDVGWDSFAPKADEFDEVEDKLLTVEERPQIENIDIRTEEERRLDEYRRSLMWKKLGESENSVSDASNQSKDRNGDLGLPRNKSGSSRRKRHDSDSDLDIPRNKSGSSRRKRHDSDSDLDIPRNKSGSSQKSQHDSDSDVDISGIKTSSRKHQHKSTSNLEVEKNVSLKGKNNTKKQNPMQSGGRGGLTSVDLLRLEMEKLKKKESEVEQMAQQYKNSTTIYRERGSGKKRDLDKEKKNTEEEMERKRKKEAQYDKWGKGLKQVEMEKEMIADTIHESSKSFTRYADDEDLETMRKAAIRDGDPMAKYFAKKKQKEKTGEKEFPKYKGPAPAPNRFKIMPGYRWDGVDRSNGFEKKYFQTISDNQALQQEYYKWSVGDL